MAVARLYPVACKWQTNNGQFGPGGFHGFTTLVSSRNPVTGGAVIYCWFAGPGTFDFQVDIVGANPSSPTFNTARLTPARVAM